jgi:hypothetical protein
MQVQQAEAKLVDGMMPLASVMVSLGHCYLHNSHNLNRLEILEGAFPEVILVHLMLWCLSKLLSILGTKFAVLVTHYTTKPWLI